MMTDTALSIESLPQPVTLAVLALRLQALNDSGLVVLGEFTFEGQTCDAGRSGDGLNLAQCGEIRFVEGVAVDVDFHDRTKPEHRSVSQEPPT